MLLEAFGGVFVLEADSGGNGLTDRLTGWKC